MNNHEDENSEVFVNIKIRQRTWYQWVLWGIWLFLEVVFFQAAVASGQELEPRAAMVFWLLFGVFTLGGVTVWIIRRQRLI